MVLEFSAKRSVAIGRAFFWTGLGCFAVVVMALILQHGFHMKPCAWCTFQRLIYLLLGLVLLVAARLVMAGRPKPKAAAVMGLIAGLGAAGGVWAALYQHFVASSQTSCDLTFADRVVASVDLDKWLPWLFKANAACSDANVPLFGLPFALWSAMAFALVCLICILCFIRLLRR